MAGGFTDSSTDSLTGHALLSSTEIYEGGIWTDVGELPLAVNGVRGASLQNTVYMMGKRNLMTDVLLLLLGGISGRILHDDIWKYDADSKQWEKVGKLSEARSYHAVTTVANKDLAQYCI